MLKRGSRDCAKDFSKFCISEYFIFWFSKFEMLRLGFFWNENGMFRNSNSCVLALKRGGRACAKGFWDLLFSNSASFILEVWKVEFVFLETQHGMFWHAIRCVFIFESSHTHFEYLKMFPSCFEYVARFFVWFWSCRHGRQQWLSQFRISEVWTCEFLILLKHKMERVGNQDVVFYFWKLSDIFRSS